MALKSKIQASKKDFNCFEVSVDGELYFLQLIDYYVTTVPLCYVSMLNYAFYLKHYYEQF